MTTKCRLYSIQPASTPSLTSSAEHAPYATYKAFEIDIYKLNMCIEIHECVRACMLICVRAKGHACTCGLHVHCGTKCDYKSQIICKRIELYYLLRYCMSNHSHQIQNIHFAVVWQNNLTKTTHTLKL